MRSLEAIVGDISELHEEDYEIVQREDGSYLIDAQIPYYNFLSYFNKTDWIDDEQEFDTLAGFILDNLERIPVTGDKLKWRGFGFEIVDMDNHRIDKLLVTLSEKLKEELKEARLKFTHYRIITYWWGFAFSIFSFLLSLLSLYLVLLKR
jgi:putative hemolysin